MKNASLFIVRNAALVLMIATTCSGCAYTHIDTDGTKHIIGLVNIKIKPCDSKEQLAGDSLSITNIGVSIYSTPLDKGFAFGYTQENITALRQDVIVFSGDLQSWLGNTSIGSAGSQTKKEEKIHE